MTDPTGVYIILGGMGLFATVMTVYDLVARRYNRRKRERKAVH
jgi:hypothetical protein